MPANNPDQNKRDAFARKVGAELQKAFPGDGFEYDPDGFRFVAAHRANAILYLAPSYAHYQATPFWRKGAFIRQRMRAFIEAMVPADTDAVTVRQNLRPKIRERRVIAETELRAQIEGRKPIPFVYRVIGDHLTLEVCLDSENTIRSVAQDSLGEWEMTFDEALDQANQNLLRLGTNNFQEVLKGVYVSAWNDDYDCCRLHLPEVIASVAVKGRPVAMIPNRNTLILTGADDADGLLHMAKRAEATLKQPGAMSGLAFRFDDRWTPYLPPPDHKAFALLKQLAVEDFAYCLDAQKKLLDALHNQQGQDIFVATPIIVLNKKTQTPFSIAVWTEGVDALLPQADLVAFPPRDINPEAKPELLMIPWATVQAAVGDLMEAQGMYPERYRVTAFPTPEQMTAPSAFATDEV